MKFSKINLLKSKKRLTLIKLFPERKRAINPERSRRAFTLIELLTVVAIIVILSTIIVISFVNAQAKARDNKRRADIQAVASAHQLLYQDTKKWHIPGTGNNGSGTGALNVQNGGTYPKSIGKGLEEGKYLISSPLDPKGEDTATFPPGEYYYTVYTCFQGVGIFARLEFPTASEESEKAGVVNGACAPPDLMNHVVIVQ